MDPSFIRGSGRLFPVRFCTGGGFPTSHPHGQKGCSAAARSHRAMPRACFCHGRGCSLQHTALQESVVAAFWEGRHQMLTISLAAVPAVFMDLVFNVLF